MEKPHPYSKPFSSKDIRLLENKTKRDKKEKRKWKPFNALNYEEKRHLMEKEAFKDAMKSVIDVNY